MVDALKKLVEQGRTVSFYKTPKSVADKGTFTAEVEFNDEDFYVFADTFQELLLKLERKEFAGEETRIELLAGRPSKSE